MLLQTSPLCLIASHLGDEGGNGSRGKQAELAGARATHNFHDDELELDDVPDDALPVLQADSAESGDDRIWTRACFLPSQEAFKLL